MQLWSGVPQWTPNLANETSGGGKFEGTLVQSAQQGSAHSALGVRTGKKDDEFRNSKSKRKKPPRNFENVSGTHFAIRTSNATTNVSSGMTVASLLGTLQ